jgi:serine/threonine protein kinase
MHGNNNIGRQIGRYKLLEDIGHGGMAVVYCALDIKLDRKVALKLLHPHLTSHVESRQRFSREARAVARLKHPSLVEIYDFSDEEGSDVHFVMELIDGTTLRRFFDDLSGETVPPEIVAIVALHICDALSHVHENGVIHRDIKPENILIGTNGEIKLSDFGIAHLTGLSQMTVTGQILGSPSYMSPEHIGKLELDARADLFSLGSVMYELATGRVPFDGITPHAVLKKVAESNYEKPLNLNPKVGHHLAKTICRCLELEPEKRYQSARELKSALADYIQQMGLSAYAEEFTEYFKEPELWFTKKKGDFVKRTLALGQDAIKKHNFAEAKDHFNYVLAIEPGNEKALALVDKMQQRRQLKRVGEIALLLVTAILIFTAVVWASTRTSEEVSKRKREPKAQKVLPIVKTQPAIPQKKIDNDLEKQPNINDIKPAISKKTKGKTKPRKLPTPRQNTNRDLVFTPNPMSVKIALDGKEPFPFGPATRKQTISVGEHTIKFIPNDPKRFVEKTWTVTIPPGEGPFNFRERLTWRPAEILVQSNGNATVTIPGRATHRAGSKFKLPVKKGPTESISILVSADGYIPITKQVTITAGELTNFTVKLVND